MNGTYIICGAVLLGGLIYYCYKRRIAQKNMLKDELIKQFANNLQAEKIEKLTLNDVVCYFKSMQLKKNIEIPFVAVTSEDNIKSYVLATYNKNTDSINNGKLITPDSIDDELQNVIGNETFVVLS